MEDKAEKGLFDFVRCACSCEVVFLEVFDKDRTDHTAFLSIYKGYSDSRMPWRDRMRFCWQTIVTGRPYGDQVCLSSDQLRKLEALAKEAAEIIEARKQDLNAGSSRSSFE